MKRKKKAGKFKIFLLFLLLILLVILAVFVSQYILHTLYPLEFSNQVEKYSSQYKIDHYLVYSVIKAESGFDADAQSPRNAKGLMQIMDSTGVWAAEKMELKDFNSEMLYDPEININIGCWYLARLLKQYDNNTELALAAYNAGSGNVSKWLKDDSISQDGKTLDRIPFEETKNYIERIKKFNKMYKKLYDKSK